jgi:alpha-tubulin suppressor-like RCC1 family protein
LVSAVALALLGAVVAATPVAAAVGDLSAVGWGSDAFGELGDSRGFSTTQPVPVVGVPDGIVQIGLGGTHSVALTTVGEVWAWGDNSHGALGDGTATTRRTPMRVPGISGAVAVAAGNGFSLAVLADGTVKAWGANDSGQLGLPAGADQRNPVAVPGLSQVTKADAGARHSVALRTDGSVWAWGFNGDGELGDGTLASRSTPLPVRNLSSTVVKVVAENGDSGALLADGSVWMWGLGSEGERGDNSLVRFQPLPVQSQIGNVVDLAGGARHTLAVRGDGTVWAWGDNSDFAVAGGEIIEHPLPARVLNLPAGMVQVAASDRTSLALDNTGTVWWWGTLTAGTHFISGPTRQGFFTNDVVVSIAAGGEHYHALMGQPGYTLGLQPSSGTTAPGGFINTTLSILPVHGFHGQVQLQISGLPAGVTASFTLTTIDPSVPSGLVLQTSASSPQGTFPVLITAIAQDNSIAQPVQTATYQLTIGAPSFTIATSPGQGTVTAGGSTTTQVALTPSGGYTGAAALAVSGLPSGVTGSFSPSLVSSGNPSTLTLQTSPGSPQGTFPVTVTATDNAVRTATFQLTISAPSEGAPGFTLALGNGEFPPVGPGSTLTTTVSLSPVNGFTGTVTLGATGLPAGVTASFSPRRISPGGQATLTLTIDSPAPGSYAVTITGTAANGTAASVPLDLAIGGPAVPDGP